MDRLTELKEDGQYGVVKHYKGGAIDKLGQLEDLEEELGCPIDVVFKALEDGIYVYKKDTITDKIVLKKIYVDIRFNRYEEEYPSWVLCNNNFPYIPIEDYKKTWWLKPSKEE